ncbi:MAG: ABC transporter permease [Planctomycetota bacterium]
MRPYLAIIKDSFRAALASRVLYVLLGLITILLLVIAPFHAREVLDWKLQYGDDVRNPITLVTQLIERKENRPEVKRIFDLLPEKTQDRAEEIYKQLQNPEEDRSRRRPGGGRRFGVAVQMINDFNKIIEDRNFYREEDWKNKLFSAEIEALLEEGVDNLSEERLRRLNRLLICAAFPSTILTGSPTALDFYYGVWKWDDISAVLTPTQLKSNMGTILPYVFDKFILSIGLAVAILVTANIIPETFNPGSLNLLLSKPVSRWALYLAKFFGGCTFIALCSVYLFFGTWLWIGLALGIWDKGLLWGIPLYILVFAIYYSVSALVGLSYRSSIMAIIVTILFWAFCFVMGTTHGFLNTYMTNKNIISITPIGDQLVAINGIGQVSSWDDSEKSWVVRSSGAQSPQENMALNTTMWFAKLMDEPVRLQPVFDPFHQSGLHRQLVAPPSESSFDGLPEFLRRQLRHDGTEPRRKISSRLNGDVWNQNRTFGG